MKKLSYLAIPFVLTGVLLTGCSSDNEPAPSSNPSSSVTSSTEGESSNVPSAEEEKFAASYNELVSLVYSTEIDRAELETIFATPSEESFAQLKTLLAPLYDKYNTAGLDATGERAFLVLLGNMVKDFPGAEGDDLNSILGLMTIDPATVTVEDNVGSGQVGTPTSEDEQVVIVQMDKVDGEWKPNASEYVNAIAEQSNTTLEAQVDIFLHGLPEGEETEHLEETE